MEKLVTTEIVPQLKRGGKVLVQPDYRVMNTFIGALAQQPEGQRGKMVVGWAEPGDKAPINKYVAFPAGGGLKFEIMDWSVSKQVYFGVGIRRDSIRNGQKGTDKDIIAMRALYLDIDLDLAGAVHHDGKPKPTTVEQALAIIAELGLPEPSLVVFTGGGLHVYWLLDKTYPLVDGKGDVAKANQGLYRQAERLFVAKGYSLDNVSDPGRMLRLPGSVNRKGEPRPVVVLNGDWERTYPLSMFDEQIELINREEQAAEERKARAAAEREARRRLREAAGLPTTGTLDDPDVGLLSEMLDYVDGDGLERGQWVAVLSAVKRTLGDGDAYEVASEWCSAQGRDRASDFDNLWEGIDAERKGAGLGTIIFLAKEGGWKPTPEQRGELPGTATQHVVDTDTEVAPISWTFEDGSKPTVVVREAPKMSALVGDFTGAKGLVVKAQKNTGKTTAVYGSTKHGVKGYVPEDASCLTITHTVALVEAPAHFGNMVSYKNEEEAKSARRVAITPNSLHKLRGRLLRGEMFEYIVIDEARQLIDALLDDEGTMSDDNKRANFLTTLRDFVRSAKQVLLLDSDADETLLILFRYLLELPNEPKRHDEIKVVYNTAQGGNGRVMMHNDKAALLAQFYQDLAVGKRCYFVTNVASLATEIHKRLSEAGYRGRLFTSEVLNSEEDTEAALDARAFIAHADERIPTEKLDYIIASPAIVTGVSIEVPWFDRVYLYGIQKYHRHTDLAQMVSRVRNVKEKEIHAWVQQFAWQGTTDPARIRYAVLKSAFDNSPKYQEMGIQFHSLCVVDGKPTVTDWFDKTYLDLYSRCKADKNRSMRKLRENFEELMRQSGYTITQAATPGKDAIQAAKDTINGVASKRELRASELLKARDLKDRAAELLFCESRPMTHRERIELHKWMAQRMFGPMDAGLAKRWVEGDGKALKGVRTLAYLLNGVEAQRADQWAAAKLSIFEFKSQAMRAELLREALAVLGIRLDKDIEQCEGLGTPLEGAAFAAWAKRNKRRLAQERLFDDENPMRLAGRVLATVGLAMRARRVRKGNELEREYTLDGEQLERALNAAEFYREWSRQLDRVKPLS